MFKKWGIPIIGTVVLSAINYYISLPALNLKSASFWGFLFFIIIVFAVLKLLLSGKNFFSKLANGNFNVTDGNNEDDKESVFKKIVKYKHFKKIIIVVAALIVLGIGVIFTTSNQMFNAPKYQQMLNVVESDFNKDIAEIPLSRIPVVDRDTAERLGSRKIGEVVELVSQFNVSNYYTQINYQNKPTRVSPLEYADTIKWFTNKDEGIPYYVKIDMATQETELVKLPEGMKYSPSEYFSRDLMRHVRFSYPTKMFDSISFEIDEKGHPYWIVSCYDYTIGLFGGYDIVGIVMVDAVSGDMEYLDVAEVPSWVDCVYNANVVLKQADYWGSYKNGYWNSIFSQKNVVKTTDGYNYLAIDDDIWVYTGITSVVADESNIGFLLVNLRTKEAKTYPINGAEEYSAMSSAEGNIQDKGYAVILPILVNIADTPSYFISLKDDAGLVKAYSFVSVANYQIVGVADTVAAAEQEYRRLLKETGKLEDEKPNENVSNTTSGRITAISSAVVNGNTAYYILLENSDKVFIANVALNDRLPFMKVNDNITVTYNEKDGGVTITALDYTKTDEQPKEE